MQSEMKQLRELCSLIADCPHSTPVWTDEGYIVIRNQHIKNGRLDLSSPSFTDAEHFAHRVRRAKPTAGDIIFTREAPMGEVCMIPRGLECCVGQRQVLLRPNPTVVDGRFLLFALQSPQVQHEISWSEGTGSTVSNVRIPVLEALRIPTPPLKTQREIGEVLGALDDRIDLLRQTNATLESIAEALYKSWFIDFDPVRAKAEGREPDGTDASTAAQFPAEFQESTLGLIPKGWSVARLGDMIELAYGKALKANDRRPGCVPVYGSGGITGYHDEALVKQASIVVGRKGTVGALYWEDAPFFPIDTTFYVKPKMTPLTFCFYTMQRLGLKHMNTDAAVPGLNRENAYRLEVLRPVEEVLTAFDYLVGPLREAMRTNGLRADTLVQLRDSLLPRLISGKLRLPEAQAQLEEAIA